MPRVQVRLCNNKLLQMTLITDNQNAWKIFVYWKTEHLFSNMCRASSANRNMLFEGSASGMYCI